MSRAAELTRNSDGDLECGPIGDYWGSIGEYLVACDNQLSPQAIILRVDPGEPGCAIHAPAGGQLIKITQPDGAVIYLIFWDD